MNPFKFFALIGIFVFMAFTSAQAQDSKATIRAAYDDLNKRDYAAFTKLVTPDFMEYAAGPIPAKTPQAAIEAYKMFFTAFPDLKFEIEDITAGTDGRYYLKTKITGTNSGSFGMLPPTGKKISLSDVDIIQLNAKGLATSHWSANPNGILSAVGYGSITNPATNIVMKGYELFGKNDIPAFLNLCADNVTFDIQDNVLNSAPKMYKGKTGVTEFFTNLASQNQYSVFQPWRFIADGDDVIILVHGEFKHMPDGKMYKTNYVHHFTVVNGKITSFKGVADFQQPEMMASR
jgi:ketosteroid isomerase-like protein